ncbi:MAG: acyl--CoA ligase [Nitrospirae bacterium]|nr:MAG: acyl--CoA ligase [Nitrospirota bacterium]
MSGRRRKRMCPSNDERDRILQAREMGGPPFHLPWRSFAEFFDERVHGAHRADKPFLTYYDESHGATEPVRRVYSYARFGELVERAATVMRERLGLRRGDRVATVLFNHDQTVLVYFAAWTLGVAVVPINIEESTEKKRYILEHSEASVVFCWQDSLDEIRSLLGELPRLREVVAVNDEGFSTPDAGTRRHGDAAGNLDDEALIVYTSGTTGPPKGVVLTARNLLVDADGIADWHGFGPDDRLMCVLPIHHVNGTVVTLVTPFYFGGGAVLNRKFKSAVFWRRIHDEGVTCVSVVPTLLEFLLDSDEDLKPYRLDRFRGVICGAGPLLKETAARFEDRFRFPIRHGYGLSETTCYSCFLPNDLPADQHRRWLTDYDFPSIGLPIRHNEMAILDSHGREVQEFVHGEICIRGRTVCTGYFKRPDANEAAFQWGWFRSGDEGFYVRDEKGRPFLFISGRIKELIIRGGVNISPLEIDDVLKGHPGVQFAMAVPFENRYYGEEIAAYVVPREGMDPPTEAALLEFCRSRLPFSKRPKVILFGQDVPYTTTGKPKRLELKTRLAGTLAAYRETQFKDSG